MQSEDSIQTAVLQWWGMAHRAFSVDSRLLVHVPNQGKRSPRQGAKFKRMGMRPGFPDLMLLVPRRMKGVRDSVVAQECYFGLFIELKSEKGRLDPAQKAYHPILAERGYAVVVAWSFEEAVAYISNYLVNGEPLIRSQ